MIDPAPPPPGGGTAPASPEEIETHLRARANHPEQMLPIRILCDPAQPGRATCIMGAQEGYAVRLATELSGHLFGFSTVFVYIDLDPGFTCPGRPDIREHCSCQPGRTP